ncbi:response regulator [Salinivibrio sp. VYel1]|uniref:response regulator n=1 Tax=Salinivibrio sp. VYel1 TaxID=2490490 RepID=UPI00128DB6AB|nr:response regulator [Salinivibrio sp. VYel1]MPX90476.1 response regulator [Salinivibrio sp. VYel1]
MSQYLVLCVDDERDVLDSVIDDLQGFTDHFEVEAAESVAEAREVIADMATEGTKLALILCDHIMPGELGVEFLIELANQPETASTRKVLLTGQAGLEDTVSAVNHASLHYYLAKPWQKETLVSVVTDQLTSYVIAHEANLLPWTSVLNTPRIVEAINRNKWDMGGE